MRYTANTDTESKLATLLDAAQSEPVIIERDQQDVAVILSARDYNRLSGKATRDFLEFCDKMADEGAANGLTEEKLQEILAHA
ncbi:MAG TPA: type II toxin-antitoxin system Phd/YefM family antitoxin [Acidobacteriaceae bacterium]|nr:type II toxin-antitoxin system Phd/YefM family antitoxin [Acidobacteriaceae bacterium]